MKALLKHLVKYLLLVVMSGFYITQAAAQNVGIGTNLPAGKLHIDLTGSAVPYAILIDDDDDPIIRIRKGGISKGFLQVNGDNVELGSYATNPLGKLVFHTNGSNRMYITPAGNVGIGTADPASKLHIIGGTNVNLTSNGFLLLGAESAANLVFDNNEIQARTDSAASSLFLQGEGGRLQLGNTSDANLLFDGTSVQALFNGSAETLILQSTNGGKVRLGNGFDFSTTKLHISTGGDAGLAANQSGYMMIGMSTAENLVFDNNEILARNNGVASTLFLARDGSKVQLGNGAEATGTKLHITSGNDVGMTDNLSGYLMMGSQTGSNLVLDINEIQARNNGTPANLYLQNGGGNVYIGDAANFTGSHRLGVDGNAVITGAVRIGNTVTPSGYKLAVDGKAICTELLVRLVPNWPDFVFSKKYNLPSLAQVEQYIQLNQHLPGIPAAKTIEEGGLLIGEMQKLQMQKIEELTLYIIDMNKQLQQLKKENDLLKQTISGRQ
ncbi:MAG: hypothetical protein NTW29_01045 [Bacteroidetes bacterium]|nr:hypothetical protein [Bacteroidota bacterium]